MNKALVVMLLFSSVAGCLGGGSFVEEPGENGSRQWQSIDLGDCGRSDCTLDGGHVLLPTEVGIPGSLYWTPHGIIAHSDPYQTRGGGQRSVDLIDASSGEVRRLELDGLGIETLPWGHQGFVESTYWVRVKTLEEGNGSHRGWLGWDLAADEATYVPVPGCAEDATVRGEAENGIFVWCTQKTTGDGLHHSLFRIGLDGVHEADVTMQSKESWCDQRQPWHLQTDGLRLQVDGVGVLANGPQGWEHWVWWPDSVGQCTVTDVQVVGQTMVSTVFMNSHVDGVPDVFLTDLRNHTVTHLGAGWWVQWMGDDEVLIDQVRRLAAIDLETGDHTNLTLPSRAWNWTTDGSTFWRTENVGSEAEPVPALAVLQRSDLVIA